MKTNPGDYLRTDQRGNLQPADAGNPDAVICRRVADYASSPPAGAALGACDQCAAPIAYNPEGPHLDRPRICMQCAGIEPLPF